MRYEIELAFRTGNDKKIEKTKVKQRICERINSFSCRSAELPDYVWIIELTEENWPRAIFKVLSMANQKKCSTNISTFDEKSVQAFCTNTGIVGAESVWISMNNTERCLREYDWAIAAIVQSHDTFAKTFETVFGHELLPLGNEDYILDLDFLINTISDYYTIQNEKRIQENGHGFSNSFEVADMICQYPFWEDSNFLAFWKSWLKSQPEYDFSTWAYLLKCMIVFLLCK